MEDNNFADSEYAYAVKHVERTATVNMFMLTPEARSETDEIIQSLPSLGIEECAGQGAGGADNDVDSETNQDNRPRVSSFEGIDAVIDDFKTQRHKVDEQHAFIQSKKDFLKEKENFERKNIVVFFSNLHDLLANKETSILCELEEKYKSERGKLDGLFTLLEDVNQRIKTETNAAENIKAGYSSKKESKLSDIKPLLNDIKTQLLEREEDVREIARDSELPTVEINDETVNVIKRLEFVKFPLKRLQIENSELERAPPGSETIESGAYGKDPALGHETADHFRPSPSAPPQNQTEEEKPPPPPYWEAVGLSSPEAKELVPHKTFPVKRAFESNVPQPVALTWNFDKLCIADKINSKLKFFRLSDGFYSEICFGNHEIYGMAFVEKYGEEYKYVVTLHRAKSLMFISVIKRRLPELSLEVKLKRGYTSIAKGPNESTFIGADALPTSGEPRVDILNVEGKILRTFKQESTFMNFSYPCCVVMSQDAIVVADSKLHTVTMLNVDGRITGHYVGTELYPLKGPINLTLDNYGNIMIMDDRTGHIHLIDLQCRPLDIIQRPKGQGIPKLIAFNTNSSRLAVGHVDEIVLYDFKGGYHID